MRISTPRKRNPIKAQIKLHPLMKIRMNCPQNPLNAAATKSDEDLVTNLRISPKIWIQMDLHEIARRDVRKTVPMATPVTNQPPTQQGSRVQETP